MKCFFLHNSKSTQTLQTYICYKFLVSPHVSLEIVQTLGCLRQSSAVCGALPETAECLDDFETTHMSKVSQLLPFHTTRSELDIFFTLNINK